MNDKRIIELIKNGQHSTALDVLYKGYPSIRKFIVTHGGSDEDARDMFQEALIIFCRKAVLPDFQLTAQVSTYLFSVCKYLWKDKLQKERRYIHNHDFDQATDLTEVLEQVEEEEKFRFLDNVLNSIGDRCKQLLQSYYIHKRTMMQIATEFGFSTEASAKNQKYKCLEKAKALAKREQLSYNQTEA